MIDLLLAWAFWVAIYLVLAGQVRTTEAVAGAFGASAAALWAAGVRRASPRRFIFEAECWAAAGRACRGLPGATLAVTVALLRVLFRNDHGTVQRSFFAHGRATDPRDSGRRAVGVLAASLAPNSVVLRTAAGRDELVLHAMPEGEPPADPRWPI